MNFETKFQLINQISIEQAIQVVIFNEEDTLKDFNLSLLPQFEAAHSLMGGFLCKLENDAKYVVYASQQAIDELTIEEIKAVLLHEKGHIEHRHLHTMQLNGEVGVSHVLSREFEADNYALSNGASKDVLISALEKCFKRSNKWIMRQMPVWKTHTPGFLGFFTRLAAIGQSRINLKKRKENIRAFIG